MNDKNWRERMIKKQLPEPEEVPLDARIAARGLKKWLQERRARGVPEHGLQDNYGNPHCPQGCTLHVHE